MHRDINVERETKANQRPEQGDSGRERSERKPQEKIEDFQDGDSKREKKKWKDRYINRHKKQRTNTYRLISVETLQM